MRRLLAVRDARLLLTGETFSMFGDRAMFLVLGIWAKTLTQSNAAAGLVFFAFVASLSLAAPLGGLVVDRVRRRHAMIATDCTVGAGVLLLLLVHGGRKKVDRLSRWSAQTTVTAAIATSSSR